MKALAITCLLLSLFAGSALAQFSPDDYFPLRVGNHWAYFQPESPFYSARWQSIDVVADTSLGVPGEMHSYLMQWSEQELGSPDVNIYREVYYSYGTDGAVGMSGFVEGGQVTALDSLAVIWENPLISGAITALAGADFVFTTEIVDTDETITTVLGTFTHCLRVREELHVQGVWEHTVDMVFAPWWPEEHGGVAGIVHYSGDTVVHDTGDTVSFAYDVEIVEVGPAVSVPSGPPPRGGVLLESAYPNPFNPAVTVAFRLDRAQRIELAVFDLAGRWVTGLLDEVRPAGRHDVVWRGRDDTGREVPAGVYLIQLRGETGTSSVKIGLVR